jgi:hypothetical protein
MIDFFMTLVPTKGLHYTSITTLVICPKAIKEAWENWKVKPKNLWSL